MQAQKDVDEALAKIKTKSRKRGDLQDETELDEKMSGLLDSMREAAFEDQEKRRLKQPAGSRMRILPLIQDQLTK